MNFPFLAAEIRFVHWITYATFINNWQKSIKKSKKETVCKWTLQNYIYIYISSPLVCTSVHGQTSNRRRLRIGNWLVAFTHGFAGFMPFGVDLKSLSYITKERLQRIQNVFSIQFTIKYFNLLKDQFVSFWFPFTIVIMSLWCTYCTFIT